MTDEERYEAVRHCRYIDEVLKDAPWETDDQFLIDNKVIKNNAVLFLMINVSFKFCID